MLKCGAKAMEENDKLELSARNDSESEGQWCRILQGNETNTQVADLRIDSVCSEQAFQDNSQEIAKLKLNI